MSNLNINKILLGGHLATDPELKKTKTDRYVTDFRMMVNRRKRDDGQDPGADAFTIVCWGKLAEMVTKFFRKGSAILVVGTVQTRSFTDSGGSKRWMTEVVASEVYFVDGKGNASKEFGQADQAEPTDLEALPAESDLPF